MLLFSVHPNVENLGNHAYYSKGFITRPCRDLRQISTWVTTQFNTPIVWSYGVRKEYNFQLSNFLVLDVDDGPSLNEAVQSFAEYSHIIGTTKSHQKTKANKIRDRYRVFLLTDRKLEKAPIYKYNNELIARQYGGDLQAVGAHMGFMPLREIISVGDEKKLWPVVEPPPVVIRRENYTPNPTYRVSRQIPRYLEHYLESGAPEGERNITCFKVASGLARAGFYEDEIVGIILSSRIPVDRSDRVQREIRSAVRNAIRRQ